MQTQYATSPIRNKQRKRFDKKVAGAKAYSVGDYVWVFQNVIPPKGTKKLLKKWRGPLLITEVHQEVRFYRLSTGQAAHFENIKPHNPSTEDWCIPQNMEKGDYLMMDSASEVNEKGTREKNDGNEALEEVTSPPQIEVPNNMEPDVSFTMQTRLSEGTRTAGPSGGL